MIQEYYRPNTLEQALALLARPEPRTVPLAGGTALDRATKEVQAVVDLQALNLDYLKQRGLQLELGAMLTLQCLLEYLESVSEDGLGGLAELERVIQLEATYNLRHVATAVGAVAAASGRSPFATALLALDASLYLLPGNETIGIGALLPFRRERLQGRLITSLFLPLKPRLTYEYIARTPADQPIVGVAAAIWPSGRVRISLGGFGGAPTLAFDGSEAAGAELAARSAYALADDEWASAEYRQEMVGVLTKRCLDIKLRS